MKTNKRELQNELFALTVLIDSIHQHLIIEENTILSSIANTRSYFHKQEVAYELIDDLNQVLKNIQFTHNELNQLQAEMKEYINLLYI
jgi:hypothetical protein